LRLGRKRNIFNCDAELFFNENKINFLEIAFFLLPGIIFAL